MFRKKPPIYSQPSGIDLPPEQQVNVDGTISVVRKPVKRTTHPDVFSLENQIKAGVPLKEENCKLLDNTDDLLDAFNNAVSIDNPENIYNLDNPDNPETL